MAVKSKDNIPPSQNTNQEATPRFFNDYEIHLTKNICIKISTIIISLIFIVSTIWGVGEIIIRPTEQKLSMLEENLETLNSNNDKLKIRHTSLQKDFEALQKHSKTPILISPVAGKSITGRNVTFKWKYDVNPGFQNFILELKHFNDEDGQLSRRYKIPRPYTKKMDFQFPENISGAFFWRVGTGELVEDYKQNFVAEAVSNSLNQNNSSSIPTETRLWSRYGNFEIYGSVLEKIKATNKLVVGITTTFLSYDHVINCSGKPITYDMEFIEWVTAQLRIKLADKKHEDEATISLIHKTIDWNNLFENVASGNVDLAIANITKSNAREKKYRGMEFTAGYRDNHQRIIFSKIINPELNKIKTLKDLKLATQDAVIAVQDGTINMEAAHHLKHLNNDQFNFKKVDNKYNSYVDVIDAVERGMVKFGMLDSVRLETVNYPQIGTISVELMPLLKKFYQDLFDDDDIQGEQYAIAVSTRGKELDFIKMLNEIITSPEGKAERIRLEERHQATEGSNKNVSLFDC
ncbi:hypothetical protein MNBD_GAMMA25-2037 [hydrothermal vent metagenome]|uniref:Solute-binding protein family 3/N-terminal domain-containing protein n=1 Tax=hydrothermal vent metagenome TaxID=652676 RepID=A0A3B1ATC1_9ZZZZ